MEVEVETRASRETINIGHSSRGVFYARGDASVRRGRKQWGTLRCAQCEYRSELLVDAARRAYAALRATSRYESGGAAAVRHRLTLTRR